MILAAALALALQALPASAAPQPVEAKVSRRGEQFVAEFNFPRESAAWAFWRSTPAEADKQSWRARSWTVLTPGVTLQRRGRYDALVGAAGRPVPRTVRVRIAPFTREVTSDYVPALLLGGRGIAMFDGHFSAFSVANPAILDTLGLEPDERLIGDGGTRVQFVSSGRRLRLAGDVDGHRRGMSSGAYGLFDVADASSADGVATVIDSEMPPWFASYIRSFTPQAIRILHSGLGPSGLTEPTILAAWEGGERQGASMNGGTLKGLILMRIEGRAALAANPELRDMARWFIAHESAHFWLGQAVRYQGSGDSWIMEGGADLLAARTVQRIDPAYAPTPFLNAAIADCIKASGKPVGKALDRGETRTIYACGTVFSLVAERSSGGDFFAFTRSLIGRNRARGELNSGDWLAELDRASGKPRLSARIRRLLETGSTDPARDVTALLGDAGIRTAVAVDGSITL